MKLKISDKTYEREQKLLYINNYKNPVNQLGFFVFVFVYVKLNSDIYKIIQLNMENIINIEISCFWINKENPRSVSYNPENTSD